MVRAISSLWDVNLFFGMMLEMNKLSSDLNATGDSVGNASASDRHDQLQGGSPSLAPPMTLIVIFLVVEIWPIWLAHDGNFVDIFLKYDVLIEQKDLRAPLLLQDPRFDSLDSFNELDGLRDPEESPMIFARTLARINDIDDHYTQDIQQCLEREGAYSQANSISLSSSPGQREVLLGTGIDMTANRRTHRTEVETEQKQDPYSSPEVRGSAQSLTTRAPARKQRQAELPVS